MHIQRKNADGSATVVGAGAGLPVEFSYGDAGLSYTAENLVSSTRSTAATPTAGREFYWLITGSGSATIEMVFSFDGGSNFYHMATGVDGGSPIVTDKIAYSNSPMIISGQCDKNGAQVAILPGAVTGTVTVQAFQ